MSSLALDPVLSCSEALAFEKSFFEGDEEGEVVPAAQVEEVREVLGG